MNRLVVPLLGILGGLVFSGCASHALMRGSVAMKVSAREAHVCLGNNEVKEGDSVALYRNDCSASGSGGLRGAPAGVSCRKVRLGVGRVKQVLNEHYSVVEVEEGVTFNEGTVVEVIHP